MAAAVPLASAQDDELFTGRAIRVGTTPLAIATADLNGDSKPDLAVANFHSKDVSILLGSGYGDFAKAKTFAVGGNAQRIAIGDLNGDGNPDLAVGIAGSDDLELLYGDGLGGFAAPKALFVGLEASSLVIQDLNGDAKADVIVADLKEVTVRISKGSGKFKAPVVVAVASSLKAITIGDLNNDATPDLVFAYWSASVYPVLACFGDGLGGFGPPTKIADLWVAGSTLAIGELTGDGIPDIVTGASFLGEVPVIPGLGGGGFATPKYFPIDSEIYDVAIADLNGDGRGDIVATSGGAGEVTSLVSAPGPDLFAAPTRFPAGASAGAIAIADLDDDGALDVTVANGSFDTVTTLFGTGDGSLAGPNVFALKYNPRSIVAADLNADSKIDLAIAGYESGGGLSKLSILLGDGYGGFTSTPIAFPNGSLPGSIDSADFDQNGKPDLVVTNSSSTWIYVLLGNGTGGFAAAKGYASVGNASNLRIGDFNGDAVPDVALTSWYIDGVAILLGDGDGGLGAPAFFVMEDKPSSLAIGDLNGDGRLDLATTSNKSTRVTVRLGDSLEAFGAPAFFEVGTVPKSAVIADLNGDSKLDIATAQWKTEHVAILWGKGNGKFKDPSTEFVGKGPTLLAVADFDSDGIRDVVAFHQDYHVMSVLRGKGAGEFKKPAHYAMDPTYARVAIADLNADGMLDLAFATAFQSYGLDGRVSLHMNHSALSLPMTMPRVMSYGFGKAGSVGVPQIQSSKPQLGSTSNITVSYATAGMGFLLLGTSAIAEPFDGGTLLVAPVGVVPFAVPLAGEATISIPLPAAVALAGSNLHFQAFVIDPLASGPYHTAQSAGLQWVIGGGTPAERNGRGAGKGTQREPFSAAIRPR